jgi:hypothetical protein
MHERAETLEQRLVGIEARLDALLAERSLGVVHVESRGSRHVR